MLFRASAIAVAAEGLAGSLAFRLTEHFIRAHKHRPGAGEVRSWERSIPALVSVLVEAGLGDVDVMLEYALPLHSKRADAVLAGVHPSTGKPSYVVVELKQWSSAESEDGEPLLCRIDAYSHPVLNPIEQVRGYCDYLLAFNGAVSDHRERVVGAAFLHNATEAGVSSLKEIEQSEHGRLFTGEQRGAFLEFLQSRLSPSGGAAAGDALLAHGLTPDRR